MEMNKGMLATALVALILAGCGGRVQPMVPGAELVQIGKGDVTSGYQYMGEVTGVNGQGCGLYGYRGTYAGAVINLRNQAYAMGANYVQIMSQTQPMPTYGCFVNEYIIEATAYRIPSTTPERFTAPPVALTGSSTASQPSAASASELTQAQQVQELQQQNLSYQEYMRRYKEITESGAR